MSTQYKIADEIPSDVICKRLKELSDAVTKGQRSILREFDMRIPAECDRDADLVLSAAAKRIEQLSKNTLKCSCTSHMFGAGITQLEVCQNCLLPVGPQD